MVPSSPKGPCKALKTTSGFRRGELFGNVALDIDARHLEAFAFESIAHTPSPKKG